MIRQSQFEKAELHRIKRRVAEDLEPALPKKIETGSFLSCGPEREASLRLRGIAEMVVCQFQAIKRPLGKQKSQRDIFRDITSDTSFRSR